MKAWCTKNQDGNSRGAFYVLNKGKGGIIKVKYQFNGVSPVSFSYPVPKFATGDWIGVELGMIVISSWDVPIVT